MSERFDDMMTELMRDVFEAQVNPQPILELTFDDATPAAKTVEEYTITVPSQSKGKKTYTSTNLSADKGRNLQLLNIALTDYVKTTDAAKRAAIRTMVDAILDAI